MNSRSSAVLLGISGVLLFSTKAIFAKMIYAQGVDHMTTLMLRMAFSVPVYLFILMSIKEKQPVAPIKHFYLFLLGFVGYYLASFLDFKGLTYIKASLERLVLFIYPTLVIIISALFLKKHITKIQKLGVLITYLGILIVFVPELFASNDQASQSETLTGGILIFFAALTYASYLVGSQWLIPSFGVRRYTSLAMIWSGVMVLIHYVIVVENPAFIFQLSGEIYFYGLLMGIISTVLPTFMISQAIHTLGAAQFSIFGSLGPVSTIVLAYIFLGERLTWIQLVGSIIVIAGVIIAEYYSKKKAATALPESPDPARKMGSAS